MFHCLHACRLLLFMFSIFLVSCEKKRKEKERFSVVLEIVWSMSKGKEGKIKICSSACLVPAMYVVSYIGTNVWILKNEGYCKNKINLKRIHGN